MRAGRLRGPPVATATAESFVPGGKGRGREVAAPEPRGRALAWPAVTQPGSGAERSGGSSADPGRPRRGFRFPGFAARVAPPPARALPTSLGPGSRMEGLRATRQPTPTAATPSPSRSLPPSDFPSHRPKGHSRYSNSPLSVLSASLFATRLP